MDERQSPESLALVIASVIVVGALVTLGSNAIEEKAEEVPSEPPPLDSPEGSGFSLRRRFHGGRLHAVGIEPHPNEGAAGSDGLGR